MDKVKNFAKIGLTVGVIDLLLKVAGPAFTEVNKPNFSPFVMMVPGLAMVASYGLMKAKKWGMWCVIVLFFLSLLATFGVMRGGDLSGTSIIPIIYVIVFGLLSFWSFQESKNLK